MARMPDKSLGVGLRTRGAVRMEYGWWRGMESADWARNMVAIGEIDICSMIDH